MLGRQLSKAGYVPEIVRVETGEEMSRWLDHESWDMVIADYSLPKFSAIRALAVLHQKNLDIPFIILSGTIGEETAVAAMKAGAHDYIMKGSAARLLPAIERELREAGERATRRKAEQALHENERRFRSLIEHSSDIITVVDVQGTILYQSPSIQRLLGYTPQSLAGTNVMDYVYADDAHALLTAITRPAGDGIQSVEFRFREATGGWRALEATISNLLDNPDVGGIVMNCRDITARKRDEATIRHLAYYDALTSLPNRILFNDRLTIALAHAKRRGSRSVAIMFLDLDRFKTINDTLGHGAGDELLKAAAERLSTALRDEDTVARLGGDEFLLLLPGVDDVEDAARLGQKVVDLFKEPFDIQDHELQVTASVGISLFPADGADGETLVRNADTALYRAKDQGRDRFQLYAPAMNALAARRLLLENGLRRAIERNELALHYQPVVSLRDGGEYLGAEALVRWTHPDLGPVRPQDFIPMAEETGLIIPLTEWILRTACTQMRQWIDAGSPMRSISVNLSARRFNESNLPAMLARVLESTGLEGHYLTLELTESVMMENAEATIATLHELKKLGPRISIDDFGTGYSSLSYLRRLPIDTLKIDQSFVRDISAKGDDAAIAMLIIDMAHNLKLSVVAEGVETEEQLSFLKSNSCDAVQGYLISEPVPAEQFAAFINAAR